MEREKSVYSAAYKLKKKNPNDVRKVRRRSLEQKQQRLLQQNRRRPLEGLSPLEEENRQDTGVHYAEKTPRKKADKGSSLLERLKVWQEERDRKRQEEAQAKKKTFRVSKNIDRHDNDMFLGPGKGKTVLKPASRSITSKSSVTMSAKSVPQVKSAVPKPVSKDKSVDRYLEKKPLSLSHGRTRAAATKQVKMSPSKMKVGKNRRVYANVDHQDTVVTEPRVTRQSARVLDQKKSGTLPVQVSSNSAGSATKTQQKSVENKRTAPSRKPHVSPRILPTSKPSQQNSKITSEQPIQNMARVTMRRGGLLSSSSEGSSFAPADFTFNASSFVFTPLSPTSAGQFLYPSQSVSIQPCSPKRRSTPKKTEKKSSIGLGQNASISAVREPVVETDSLENDNQHAEKPFEDLPRTRRSVRRSINSTGTDSPSTATVTVATGGAARSIDPNVNVNSVNISPVATSARRRRSRISDTIRAEDMENSSSQSDMVPQSDIPVEGANIASSTVFTPVEKRSTRLSLRRSLLQSRVPHQDVVSEDCTDDTVRDNVTASMESPRKRVRTQEASAEQMPNKELRSKRKSVATPVVVSDVIIEEKEEAQDCAASVDNVLICREQPRSAVKGQEPLNLDSPSATTEGSVTVPNKKTPVTKRNKSFGGFQLPNAGSAVLSASRRRTRLGPKTPRSPEEWIELLSNSPMVEMSRRKPKLGNMSLPALKFEDHDLDDAEPATKPELIHSQTDSSEDYSLSDKENISPPKIPKCRKAGENNSVQPETNGSSQTTETNNSLGGSDDSGEHDVLYFRNLLSSETKRLNESCAYWDLMNTNPKLSEDIQGEIRTTVGQAQLLMDQRFKQFSGLVDNCEFKRGEKETTCTDLQGFWDMVYYQVEDVDAKFEELKRRQANNWEDDKPKPEVKKIKKKVIKPVQSKPVGKSKFAAFRAQMKKQKETEASEDSNIIMGQVEEKTFDAPGFFKVTSPVRSPKPHCAAGSPAKRPASLVSSSSQSSLDGNINSVSSILTPKRKSYAPLVDSPLLIDSTPKAGPSRTGSKKTPIPRRVSKTRDPPVMDSPGKESSKKATPRRSMRARKSVHFPDNDNLTTFPQESLSINGANEPMDASGASYSEPIDTTSSPRQRRSTRLMSRPSLLYTPPQERTAVTPSGDVPTGILISFSP